VDHYLSIIQLIRRTQTTPTTIDTLVKKDVVEALKAKGFSDLIAKKACLLSGNKDVESAEKWIEEHKNDADFNEPVQIGKKA
jgi:uncharacterized UBP type Zn finger protein